ncbi:5-dehydro-4-deoxy-D-glucuronate isomerase [Sphingobacterium spiritivorum]|uniref:4-deoxy-L-threo-5-hexosulose-uronate ketol-isomerase n=1 Tax=Sphingobacterium spiritivorum ATCC 33861 TaxID=525373 RepID=D7VIU3_SPHSI|nr:5-dehydro-4-deoxy-D-glucuronate isomerase [Sphingobacterium spiritivorum]EFK59995.1 4-deoxy-L-threo-5-hexosulose-uronate ketol-isomerase [Sphingobacterium spiritivorum ATCC 33861]QQT37375.1 5-dehydro-4-deoxy-D-glucuronate isomerase [Sphingobacterium spiritivorum]WQD34166.1 5-dehydro-4-deoxy-D-glucuronate isomerase [Sphingobacterium spiritivorum]SUI96988.1 4-deoxy-L-threo-5-hexosulose-uronate ketol-isomerase [Sphingobacterium spiritivorum]
MKTIFESRYAIGPQESKTLDTAGLRKNFLIEKLFDADQIHFVYTHYDRYMAGGAMPVSGKIKLDTIPELLKEEYFLSRRELGIINVGGKGSVEVDGTVYELDYKEALYIGKGNKEIFFSSEDAQKPAKFYMNSTPAHRSFPTKKVTKETAIKKELGTLETANHRTINQMLLNTVLETCQLQMGMTELQPGSVWNTMPAHTHDRRMEVYFYFEVPQEQSVCHFMGQPDETRHIWMQNDQAVISPPWSIHSGAGTSNYTFIWGMAGENLDYDDMDKVAINDLK